MYEKCKHSKYRLSEKRLIEWKVRERQLEKFLRQFQPRPQTSHALFKPRPSSSRAPPEPRADVTSRRSKTPEHDWVRLSRSVLHDQGSASRKRLVSAVSFSSRAGIISGDSRGEQTDRVSAAQGDPPEPCRDDDEEVNEGPNDSAGGSRLHVFQSGLRSLSAASFHSLGKKGTSTSRVRSSEDWSMSEIPEENSRNIPALETLSASQVAENFKSSTRNYRAFVRARSFSGTKFFVTKDNVVMTNAFHQTCKELHVNESPVQDSEETSARLEDDGYLSNFRNTERVPSTAEKPMSVCSFESSEDSVFAGSDHHATGDSKDDEKEDLAVVDVDESFDSGSGDVVGDVTVNFSADRDRRETSSDVSDREKDSIQNEPDSEAAAEEQSSTEPSVTKNDNNRHPSVDRQSVLDDVAADDCGENGQASLLAPSVSVPMKKLTILENKHVGVDGDGQSVRVVQGRRHSFQPLSQHRPATSHLGGGDARRNSLIVGKESTGRSPKTLLMKRRQSSAAVLRTSSLSGAVKDPSSVTTAMTVKPLLTKDNHQTNADRFSDPNHNPLDTTTATLLVKLRSHSNTHTAATTTTDSEDARAKIPHLSKDPNRNSVPNTANDETSSNCDDRLSSHSRRRHEAALEQPQGLRPSVSSLGTVLKAAMVFSKAARRRALSSMVEENNVNTREIIRKERLRKLQSRASVLSKIVSQFPVQGDECQ